VNLLVGAATIGFILALLGLGVFVSYRVYTTIDLTADGSFGVGAAVAGALLVQGVPPLIATGAAMLAGMLAGAITGVVHTRFLVHALLAGVLTSTALYSVSLFVMGTGNLSLASAESLVTVAERIGEQAGLAPNIGTLVAMAVLAVLVAVGLGLFLATDLGLAMRAAGNNPQMAKAVAIDVDRMVVLGLGVANGLIALSGALLAQYEGLANIQMGIGALVIGLANLMVGEALLGRATIARWIAGAVVGAVVFRMAIAAAVRAGMNPNALKLVTAGFVLVVLALPHLLRRQPHRPAATSARTHG
jgi:putative ABC transport system permease protein